MSPVAQQAAAAAIAGEQNLTLSPTPIMPTTGIFQTLSPDITAAAFSLPPLSITAFAPSTARPIAASASVTTDPNAATSGGSVTPQSIFFNNCAVANEKLQVNKGVINRYVYGLAQNRCDDSIAWQWVCTQLDEFWVSTSSWHNMSGVACSNVEPGGQTITESVRIHRCTTTQARQWRIISTGSAENSSGDIDNGTTTYGGIPLSCRD